MTISVDRPNRVKSPAAGRAAVVEPADVWDLDRSPSRHCSAPNVRTLSASNRKEMPGREDRKSDIAREGQTIETRGEKRAATVMGALLGMALLVGSALGGAFAGGDAGYAPEGGSHPAVYGAAEHG